MANKCTMWGHRFTHRGNAFMEFRILIPVLLYFSDTTMAAENGTTRMRALHITPSLTIGINWRGS